MPKYYYVFNISSGWVSVSASEKGLTELTLPQNSAEEARRALSGAYDAVKSPGRFEDIAGRIRAYFEGKPVEFPDELDLSGATPFQKLVWEKTKEIPYGQMRSYGWIAAKIRRHKAARAVGHALGKNPLPIIIPCHRVIGSDGGLCGFAGGLEMKRRLLELERKI